MPTVGNTTTPAHNWFFQGVNTPPNQVASAFTMPAGGGLLTTLHAFFALNANGPATAWLCLWNSSKVLVEAVPVTVANGTHTVGGQAWYSGSLSTPRFMAGGATFYLGWSVSESNGFVSTDESSGTSRWNTDATPPGDLTSDSATPYNAIGAYADYLPVIARVRRSGAWAQTGTVKVRRSGAWTQATRLRVRRSGAWVDAQ